MAAVFTLDRLCCPRCRAALIRDGERVACTSADCLFSREGFPVVANQPVLVDFEESIFDRAWFESRSGASYMRRDDTGETLAMRVRKLTEGPNRAARENAALLSGELRRRVGGRRATLLVVGGGALGDGVDELARDPAIETIATDVYPSVNTVVVADGHRLPFPDESVDAVWIQAVLEHVLEPWRVAGEIERVLRPGGLVYADTPFMQQVHEGAYDFTRFTLSGHRWLFRDFAELRSGAVGGAGTALWWAIHYLIKAFVPSDKLARLLAMPFFPLRFLDRWAAPGANVNAAGGVFFLGAKNGAQLAPREIVSFYEASRHPRAPVGSRNDVRLGARPA